MQWLRQWVYYVLLEVHELTMRREHIIIQHVPHLQRVIGKPDVGKSCQGRAIKVNARESYDLIPAADHLWRGDSTGRTNENTVIFRRMLTGAEIRMEATMEDLLSQIAEC